MKIMIPLTWKRDCRCKAGMGTHRFVTETIQEPNIPASRIAITYYPMPTCLACNKPWKLSPMEVA